MKYFFYLIVLLVNINCYPVITDWFRYSDLGANCSGTFSYDLKIPGAENSDKHCSYGRETFSTESGFRVSADFADKGQLLLYGDGEVRKNKENPIHLGLFRTAGERGNWYCISSGQYKIEGEKNHFDLKNIFPLKISGTGNTITSNSSGEIEFKIGTETITTANSWGYGCDTEYRRCSFLLGQETRYMRVSLHTETPMNTGTAKVKDAFILLEDARSPRQLKLLTANSKGSTVRLFPEESGSKRLLLNLIEISDPVLCPDNAASGGALTGYWER